jgi:hypothetical protein
MVTAHRLDFFSFKLLMQSSPIHTLVQFWQLFEFLMWFAAPIISIILISVMKLLHYGFK